MCTRRGGEGAGTPAKVPMSEATGRRWRCGAGLLLTGAEAAAPCQVERWKAAQVKALSVPAARKTEELYPLKAVLYAVCSPL